MILFEWQPDADGESWQTNIEKKIFTAKRKVYINDDLLATEAWIFKQVSSVITLLSAINMR